MKNKPYAKGQKPFKCGHYYPDVLRNFDKILNSNRVKRFIYCFKCKKEYYRLIRKSDLFRLVREKRRTIKELSEVRKKELERLRGNE